MKITKYFLILCLLLTACTSETDTIKIGVIAPLNGDAAFIGEGVVNGIILAQEQHNSSKYEIIFEDDRLDPKMSATAINKLVAIDKVDAVISITSGTGNVVVPITQQNNVVHIAIASDISLAKHDLGFVHWTPPAKEAEKWVEEAQKRGIKRIAVLALQQQGAELIVNEIKARLPASMEIVHESNFASGETDFRTMILKAKQTNPDIYFIGAFSPEIELLGKQLKAMNIETPVTTIEAFEFTTSPELFEGQWYVNAADPTEEFVAEYNKKYNKNPTMGAPNAYDAFNLLVNAFDKAEQPEKVAEVLQNTENFSGALGNLNVDSDGVVLTEAVIRIIKNSTPQTLK